MKKGSRFAVGALVVERGAELDSLVRMVLGYKRDGRCMTTFVDPPPWMGARVFVDAVSIFRPLEEGCVTSADEWDANTALELALTAERCLAVRLLGLLYGSDDPPQVADELRAVPQLRVA